VPSSASQRFDPRSQATEPGTPGRRAPARFVAAACVVAALPLVIGLGVVRFAFSWQPVYSYAVTAYHPEDATGVSAPQLLFATQQIRNYFSNGNRDLRVEVATAGGNESLFNEREVAHMRDVKALVRRAYALLNALAAVAAVAALALVLDRGGPRRLARAVLAGSILTGAIVTAFGAASLLGFSQLFTEFHLLSFSNDLWELDPLTDHLVQLFPLGYWFDVTMFVAALVLVIALLLASSAAAYLVATRRRP
jgi:integral membrane protein (TIGR01906 family)